MTVSVQPKPLAIGNPSAAFEFGFACVVGLARFFDITRDGHVLAVRSLAPKEAVEQPNQLRVILNWDEELKRLAPAKP